MNAAQESEPEPIDESNLRIEDDPRNSERDVRYHSQPNHEHRVELNYHPLLLRGQRLTGLEIKQQAIAAPIPNIQLDFHLTVERDRNDVEHTIGDDEAWTVHDGDCFTAVKPDDNS